MIWVCVAWAIAHTEPTKSISSFTANDFYVFKNAWATSTFIDSDGNLEEFSPLRVIQPGPSFWCSSGSHSASDIVSWTGEFAKQPLIETLTIDWTYAPKEFQISASADGINYTSLMPFQPILAQKPSFTQFVKLPVPFLSKELKISMKNPQDNFFGISSVKIRAAGNPLFMLKSGITCSGGELCLVNKNNKPLLINCLEAIAISSGIELWRFNSNQQIVSISPLPDTGSIDLADLSAKSESVDKCLAVPLNSSNNTNSSAIGQIFEVFMANCDDLLDQDDAFSRWNFESNSQISLLSPQPLCLSQVDIFPTQSGESLTGNVNLTGLVEVEIKSLHTKGHEPKFAIDNKLETYWASPLLQPNDINKSITVELLLKNPYLIDSIVIYWEYPAFSYLFKTSLDNINYNNGPYNASNGSTKTVDMFGIEAKYIQLTLLHPHINYKVKNNHIYGIREIQIMTYATNTVVENCKIAANSSDARDKYFVDYVTQYDPNISKSITTLEANLVDFSNYIFEKSDYLNEKLSYLHDALEQSKEFSDTLGDIDKFLNEVRKESPFDTYDKSYIGESKNLPADSCQIVLTHNKHAKSGFYWLNPACSPFAYRAYCHFYQAQSKLIFIEKAEGNISNQNTSIARTCAKYGLEPLILSDKLDYDALVASVIAFGVTDFIPLAKDYQCHGYKCSGNFYDLFQGIENVTNLLKFHSNTSPGEFDDLAGFTYADQIVYKKSSNTNITYVVCTDNGYNLDNFEKLSCDDVLIGNEKLLGELNTSIYVECPTGCQHSKMPIYGSNYAFSETSSICKAAIESGVISDGGRFVITIEGPLSMDSQNTNNIDTGAKTTGDGNDTNTNLYGRLSFRINRTTKKCPIDILTESKHTYKNEHVHKQITHELLHNSDLFFGAEIKLPASEYANEEVDPWTEKLSKFSVDQIDTVYGIDPLLAKHSVEEAIITIDKFSKKFKKVARRSRKLFIKASNVLDELERLHNDLEVIHSERSVKLGKIDSSKEDKGFDLENTPIFTEFKLDTSGISVADKSLNVVFGTSDEWRIVNTRYHSINDYLAHYPTSNTKHHNPVSDNPPNLSIALIKSHKFFNFKLIFSITSLDDKICGIIFRYHDNFNYYKLLFDTLNGETRLEIVSNGRTSPLATVKNGGLTPERWTKVTLSADGPLITVDLGRHNTNILSVLDETISSGSIGFYSTGDTFYSNLTVSPLDCTQAEQVKSLDIKCSNFVEEFLGDPYDTYDIGGFSVKTNNENFVGWSYSGNMLVQKSPLAILESIALLSHNRKCKLGVFSFLVWPERKIHATRIPCVGAVFFYKDNNNFGYLSLQKDSIQLVGRKDGTESTVKKVELKGFTFHKWHNVFVKLATDNNVNVTINDIGIDGKMEKIAVIEGKFDGFTDGNRIGLFVNNITRVLFKDIQLHDEQSTSSNVSLLQQNEVSTGTDNKIWDECLAGGYYERLVLCKEIRIDCNNFCVNCCKHHTSLLSKQSYDECLIDCQNIQTPSNDKKAFDKYIQSCSPLPYGYNKPHFKHCQNDNECIINACILCCESGINTEEEHYLQKCYQNCTKSALLLAKRQFEL